MVTFENSNQSINTSSADSVLINAINNGSPSLNKLTKLTRCVLRKPGKLGLENGFVQNICVNLC